jgi:hypothetical protein
METQAIRIPIIESKTYRLSFSNASVKDTLDSLSPKFRSYFVEMVVGQWIENNPGESIQQLKITMPDAKTKRYRLKFNNAAVRSMIDSLSPKFRSYFAEMLIDKWLENSPETLLPKLLKMQATKKNKPCAGCNNRSDSRGSSHHNSNFSNEQKTAISKPLNSIKDELMGGFKA